MVGIYGWIYFFTIVGLIFLNHVVPGWGSTPPRIELDRDEQSKGHSGEFPELGVPL